MHQPPGWALFCKVKPLTHTSHLTYFYSTTVVSLSVMRMVLIGPGFPHRGGLAIFDERFIYEAIRRGWDAHLWSFTLLYPSFLFPGKTQFREEPPAFDIPITQKVNTINPFNWLKTGYQLRGLAPHLVVFRYWIPHLAPAYGTIARLVCGPTVRIAIVDNPQPHEPSILNTIASRYFFRAVDGFLTLSAQAAHTLQQMLPSKPIASAVHPLYDTYPPPVSKQQARKELHLPEDTPIVLFFGLVRPYKGLDLLIRAAATAPLSHLHVKFLVAGEFYFGSEPHYRQLIKECGVEKKFIIHNWFIPDSKVHLYFSAADLIVQPYISATQSGVTQLAYHYEKPMVVTRVGSLPEQVAHGVSGLVVEPHPTQIARAIYAFFTDGQLAERLQQGTKKEKQRFSWSALLTTLEQLYTTLAQNLHPTSSTS